MKRGKYELKKRAERQEETRLRIARATLELHESVGPALTTRSAIAQRAGVTRPTVYSHFPDDLSLGKACSSLSPRTRCRIRAGGRRSPTPRSV
jgi:hypothetical protein